MPRCGGQLHERQNGELKVAIGAGEPPLEPHGCVADARLGGHIADSIAGPHPREGYPVQLDVRTIGQAILHGGIAEQQLIGPVTSGGVVQPGKTIRFDLHQPLGDRAGEVGLGRPVGTDRRIGHRRRWYGILCEGGTCKQCGK